MTKIGDGRGKAIRIGPIFAANVTPTCQVMVSYSWNPATQLRTTLCSLPTAWGLLHVIESTNAK
jgi:hypothetical protein